MEDVSTTIISTCQMDRKMQRDVFDSMQFNILSPWGLQTCMHSFHCGSSAEFYIRPINSCIDDIDSMKFRGNDLAFIEDIPVLPDDYRGLVDTIQCLQVMPYHNYPGFVRLQHLGTMVYNWHCRKFQFHKTEGPRYLIADKTPLILFDCPEIDIRDPGKVGPALRTISDNSDLVPSYWCPQWPKEAQDWPFRQRNSGWPATDNISKIVQSGCHVVCAKHPDFKNDEQQWRLSFSGAELCLLQSWTLVQQIVYHMIRFFAKRELIKKDCPKEDELLCTYHLKTLMLWSCEEMPQKWWNESPVVEICCNLLPKLSEWLNNRYCPNYFIPQANLFHEGIKQKLVTETINRLNEFCNLECLNAWYLTNYVMPVLVRVLTFKDDAMTLKVDVGYCMLRICEILDGGKLEKFDNDFCCGFWFGVSHTLPAHRRLERGYMFHSFIEAVCCKGSHDIPVDMALFKSTVEFSSKFPQFGKVLFILLASNELGFKQTAYDSELFTEFIREVSWQPRIVRSKYHNFPKPCKTCLYRSDVLLLKAQDLMENVTGLNSPQEFKLLSQLSKDLLRNAIYCDDLRSGDIRSVALVYVAALHFSESDYETAIDLCFASFDMQGPDRDNEDDDMEEVEEQMEEGYVKKETLNAECLLHVDLVVRFTGFYLLVRRIVHNFYDIRRRYLLELRFSPGEVSHYFIVPSNERRRKANRLIYDLKALTYDFSESHRDIIIDLSSTIPSSQTPGPSGEEDNKEKEEEEEEEKEVEEEKKQQKETPNERCMLPVSESNFNFTIELDDSLTVNHPPIHCEKAKDTLNAVCLLYIDDVAACIGFYLIFRRVQDNYQYNCRRRHLHDFRLTPEVFAHYIIISLNKGKSKTFRKNYDLKSPQFLMDEMLTAVARRKYYALSNSASSVAIVYQRTETINKWEAPNKEYSANEDDIIQLLMEYSLQNMTSFYDRICKDFGVTGNTVDCYRAAYLYKCRKYPEVLHLCQRILDHPDLHMDLEEITFANVMVMPPLDSYFDTDIQCLLGLDTLVCYLSPLNEDLCKLQDVPESKFQHIFAKKIYFEKRPLAVILCTYSLKRRYFIGRHFLARYLKLRCAIDHNHPGSAEVMVELKKLKSQLPFEHIICCFLQKRF